MLDGKKPANNEPIRPVSTPNRKMQYSGGGTLITKKILQDKFGSNYDSLMQRLVFKPLSMKKSSFLQPLSSKIKNVALAYDGNKVKISGGYNIYPEQAPDGLWTTPSDLAMDGFGGDYFSDNPAVKISISKQNGQLELQVKRKERMYFINEKAFFLKSSPDQIAEFDYSDGVVNAVVLR
jgi:CubicO group peptidase (beta-lactamase class C family)